MTAQTVTQWLRRSDHAWFDRALSADQFTTHFQPIVNFRQGSIHGHECLVRLFADRPYNGGEIMAAALDRGNMHVFDAYTRKLSVRSAALQHTPGTKVFINFIPSSIYDPAFCMRSTFEALKQTQLKPEDIVFEVVESETVQDLKHLHRICRYYRDCGFGIALDDVGTGSNSLQMVCELMPDYIKLDKSLVSRIGEPAFHSAVGKIAELASEFRVQVIAEGIEDLLTAERCADMGISLMQGYYFARPAAEMVASAIDLLQLARHIGVVDSFAGRTSLPAPVNP